ncbi:MAG TPA: ATP-binding protein [Cyclobacteriaceae bacterium]|jgi:two-component system phosphate regulon sensor histidine kinase PhoR
MRFNSSSLALIVSILVSALVFFILTSVKTIEKNEISLVILFTFIGGFIIAWVILEFLVFRNINSFVAKLRQERNLNGKSDPGENNNTLAEELNNLLEDKNRTIDELKKLAAFRKEFIADVSHELKTPIFAAQGFVHTLLDGAVKDKSVRNKFLKKAARSLDGLDALVQDLVTLSQMEIGEVRMHREYFDIMQLTQEVIDQFEHKAEKKTLKLLYQGDTKQEILVYADPHRIFQVLSNLISNSINYTDEGGQIYVEIIPNQDHVWIKIKDTGIGIPKEDLARIFQRFYRVDKSRSRKQGGTGLGLAIVKHIIELHKSEVKVESEVGMGSTFSFKLPKEKTPQKKRVN